MQISEVGEVVQLHLHRVANGIGLLSEFICRPLSPPSWSKDIDNRNHESKTSDDACVNEHRPEVSHRSDPFAHVEAQHKSNDATERSDVDQRWAGQMWVALQNVDCTDGVRTQEPKSHQAQAKEEYSPTVVGRVFTSNAEDN